MSFFKLPPRVRVPLTRQLRVNYVGVPTQNFVDDLLEVSAADVPGARILSISGRIDFGALSLCGEVPVS